MIDEKYILVVDDEPAILDMVEFALKRQDFRTKLVVNAMQAMNAISETPPDLILLDWMLPDLSGVDLARRLKRDDLTKSIPIIMITARAEEGDKLRGFDVGVDDYVTKPFSPRELIARINAVLRRIEPETIDQNIDVEGLNLDPVTHRVNANGSVVELGPTEFRLLQFFMTHTERVYSREQLLDRVWGQNVYIEDRTVDVHIRRLRKVLSEYGYDKMIQTVRGSGYRFSKQIK
ncbi:MAG: phosphate regulon transcriptional regulatory protein PhoB [Gammaproteobacteria bacterium]|nr:phosphate regulon transcriptional regulatory protein PhoB [Gammaproteobacteria bacterium]